MKKLILISLLILAGCDQRPSAIITAQGHAHKWGRWSDPKIAGDWFSGTQQWQTRICETCGEAETRMTQVAPGAPPK